MRLKMKVTVPNIAETFPTREAAFVRQELD
jgi:hypothetical protein